jgi:hypothetical protein
VGYWHACGTLDLIAFLILLLLTLTTQIGGLVFVVCWVVNRFAFPVALQGWHRAIANVAFFVILYAAATAFLVPPWAALGGREPLPCHAESDRPFAAGHPLYCLLNRHYVEPRLVTLLTELSRHIDRAHPGTTTLFLDGNFPFLNGFPLLPHLSHSDGRKLDLAFYYQTPAGTYLPGRLRSPIGYWAFEQPQRDDPSPCVRSPWLTLRWDMKALQSLYPSLPLEPQRTRAALQWLVTEGERFAIERVFIEPYLASRLGVSSPRFGFQGCRAARHDDHIHIQIKP